MAGETVARLGGDEFAVVYPNADAALLAAKAQELIRRLALPIELAVGQLFTSASIGGTLIANPQADAGEALRQADVALYCAKAQGRGLYREFDPRMDFERQTRSEIEADLRTALALRRLDLAYQPQVDRAGRVDGVEALIRWNHPSRGFVSPSDFVPIAEECGLIAALGEFVMERAFADARRWPNVTMAVNVSAIQLRTPGFCDAVLGILRRTGANPRRIELEITESILLDKDECTQEVFRKLRAIGFSIAVDDFGIGFSSLSILHSLPLDKIKIDRSFVTSLGLEPEPEKIVIAILGIAAALDLKVVAEGVETPQQLQVLTRAGCRHFQGFLFHRPVAAEGVDQILSGDATLVLTA
jgi:predicted signal transduction protein with EAL and GGDEF domain